MLNNLLLIKHATKMNLSLYRFLFLFFLICFACNEPSVQKQNKMIPPKQEDAVQKSSLVKSNIVDKTIVSPTTEQAFTFNYNLNQWTSKMILDMALTEISGLAFLEAQQQLLAINDEQGIVFFLDESDGSIVQKESFAKQGDYEAIALVDDEIYISKSNGNLYYFNLRNDKQAKKIKTPLDESNDVEGMCYDKTANRLLIACKGKPGLEKAGNKKSQKSVYAFDLNKKKLQKDPFLKIKDKDLEHWVENNQPNKEVSKKQLNKHLERVKKFSPSSIAIHPKEQAIYMLSSVGKILVICQANGSIEHVEFLNDNYHRQPEGLCFSPKGDLYISNEGKGFPGIIYKYIYTQQ